jgi:hypothetical protein
MPQNNRNNRRSYRDSSNNQYTKHSGAKMGLGKNGLRYIQAWNYSKSHGMVSMISSQRSEDAKNKKGERLPNVCVNRSGEQLEIWVCKFKPKMGNEFLRTGFFNPNTKKLFIPDEFMMASPNSPNGGYFGRIK